MMYVVALALLLLAAAVVLLFAMMGEFAARLPGQAGEAGRLSPIGSYRRDATTSDWPAELALLSHEPSTALLVLSPICTTCGKVAASLMSRPLDPPLGLVISCNGRSSGEDFITKHALQAFPHFIDEGGAWTSSKVGINQSPVALVFAGGKLTGAYSFSDVSTVMQLLDHKITEDAI